jgi:hypothetical protein
VRGNHIIMRMRASQDIVAGAVIVTLAVAVLVALSRIPAAKYQVVGPDLFPRVCTYALMAGGIALLLRGFLRPGPAFAWPPLRGVVLVVLAVVSFGLIAPRFGFAVAGFLTIVVSGFATREVKPLSLIVFAIGMVTFSVVLFSYVLKVPMPAFALRGLGA